MIYFEKPLSNRTAFENVDDINLALGYKARVYSYLQFEDLLTKY